MNERKDNKIQKYWVYKAIGLICIGIIIDIVVFVTKFALFEVSESYMECIYSAIVTISVLSFTLIALLSGMLNTCYYGYELKDIIGFKNTPINFKKLIYVSFIFIAIATIILILNCKLSCVNTLIWLLFSMVYIMAYTSLEIYKIMTNDEYCVDVVKNYYENIQGDNKMNFDLFKIHLNKLSVGLENSIKKQNREEKDTIWKMICTLCKFMKSMKKDKEYYRYFNYLNVVIKKHIIELSLNFGYNEMVRVIVELYETVSDNQFDRNDILILPLEEMEFYDDKTLLNLNYLDELMYLNLQEVYEEHKIKDEEVQVIFYNYISSIFKNQLCSIKCKNKMIVNYFNKLTRFRWNSENRLLQVDQIALLNVLKYYILQNEDSDERKFIFEELIKNTFTNNLNNESKTYYNYLSIIFQVFYAYITMEGEMLHKNYRENIKNLFQTDITTPNIVKLNVAWLVRLNIKGVLCALANRIQKEDEFIKTFEYFPPYFKVKSIVFTKEFNIKFMFLIFILYNDIVGFYSLYEYFFSWKTMNSTIKLNVLYQFMSYFDNNTSLIKRDTIEEVRELSDLVQYSFSINECKQIKLFEHLREEQEKLYLNKINETIISKLDSKGIKRQLKELMKQEKVFGWDEDYTSDFYVKYSIPDFIWRNEHRNNKTAARSIRTACISAINNYIYSETDKLILSFDEVGIKNFLKFLNKTTYDSRNYTFTDDMAFYNEIRESSDFKEIIGKNSCIENIDTTEINRYMYFNKNNFKFNVKISNYEDTDLTEEESIEYIENSKTYNGLYNIDEVLMAKDKAIRTVQKSFYRERIAIVLMVSFKHADVTHIEFQE